MKPTIDQINEEAYQPYVQEEMNQIEALAAASVPIKEFMINKRMRIIYYTSWI